MSKEFDCTLKIKNVKNRLLVKYGQSEEFRILAAIQKLSKDKIETQSIFQLMKIAERYL